MMQEGTTVFCLCFCFCSHSSFFSVCSFSRKSWNGSSGAFFDLE
jgi:hypothetical protein